VVTRFFILSSARSGSAWVANYLSYGGVACLHEPLAECASLDQLEGMLAGTKAKVAGIADTLSPLMYRALKRRYPDAYYLVNTRPLPEVEKSVEKLGLDPTILPEIDRVLANMAMIHGQVDWGNPEYATRAYRFVYQDLNGYPMPMWRSEQLAKFNVQTDVASLIAGIEPKRLEQLLREASIYR
jgi:hypothetical protein